MCGWRDWFPHARRCRVEVHRIRSVENSEFFAGVSKTLTPAPRTIENSTRYVRNYKTGGMIGRWAREFRDFIGFPKNRGIITLISLVNSFPDRITKKKNERNGPSITAITENSCQIFVLHLIASWLVVMVMSVHLYAIIRIESDARRKARRNYPIWELHVSISEQRGCHQSILLSAMWDYSPDRNYSGTNQYASFSTKHGRSFGCCHQSTTEGVKLNRITFRKKKQITSTDFGWRRQRWEINFENKIKSVWQN